MSTARPAIEISNPKAYQDKMMKLLGDRDPCTVLAETPQKLREIVKSRSAGVFKKRPYEGKWTPNEVLGHLIDAEWTLGFRGRMILAHDRPTLLGMDQEDWVRAQKYNDRDAQELVEDFAALRKVNLRFWKSLRASDLERVGQHSERGPESLGMIMRMYSGHDLSHIDQITRYLAAIEGK